MYFNYLPSFRIFYYLIILFYSKGLIAQNDISIETGRRLILFNGIKQCDDKKETRTYYGAYYSISSEVQLSHLFDLTYGLSLSINEYKVKRPKESPIFLQQDQFSYINLPISLQLNVLNSNFLQVDPEFGLNTSYLHSVVTKGFAPNFLEVNYKDGDNAVFNISEFKEKQKLSNYNRIGLGIISGVKFIRSFNKATNVFLRIRLDYDIFPTKKAENQQINIRRMLVLNYTLGCSFHIKK